MELFVKTEFTKAISICGDDPVYENVKDFMQDMMDENVSLSSKDTPVHLIKFMITAAYNSQFSPEFRECIENVLFSREIDDKAAVFHLRKLRKIVRTKDEEIQKLTLINNRLQILSVMEEQEEQEEQEEDGNHLHVSVNLVDNENRIN